MKKDALGNANISWTDELNKDTELDQSDQKLQTTTRFRPETLSEIEKIQEQNGGSFAGTVRRLVKRGLDSI